MNEWVVEHFNGGVLRFPTRESMESFLQHEGMYGFRPVEPQYNTNRYEQVSFTEPDYKPLDELCGV